MGSSATMYSSDLASIGYGREIFEPEHEAYRDLFRKFMKREIEPNVKEWEKRGFFPAEVFKKAGNIGLLGPFISTEYGGVGGDFRYKAVHFEEHAYSPAGASFESGLTTDCVIEIIQ